MALAVGPNIEDGLWHDNFVYTLPTTTKITKTGSTGTKSYSSAVVVKAKVEKKTPKKTGVIVSFYEPEVIALLMGEL